jgi:hypothetical protein
MLPTDADARKRLPIYSGVIRYFPHAIAAVAELSRVGNDQHNPGQPLHWAKEKSSDEPDALARHLTDMAIDQVHRDPDGVMAAVKLAWRALANLERMHDAGVDIFAIPVRPVRPALQPFPGRVNVECEYCRRREGEEHRHDCVTQR